MHIGGFLKNSLSDYPGRIAAVCFTQGCNLQCLYCHNAPLTMPSGEAEISLPDMLAYLQSRMGQLDGVVFSGGEPLMQPDLLQVIQEVKAMHFAVKLDTNGTMPQHFQAVIQSKLLDYVAMDYKADDTLWPLITGSHVPYPNLEQSLNILLNSSVDYEIRITLVPAIHTESTLAYLSQKLKGAKRIRLQTLSGGSTLHHSLDKKPGHTAEALNQIKARYFGQHPDCQVRH